MELESNQYKHHHSQGEISTFHLFTRKKEEEDGKKEEEDGKNEEEMIV